MRRLAKRLDGWGLGAWARAFFIFSAGALLAAPLSTIFRPAVEELRAASAQLSRSHQALQARLRRISDTRGGRDLRLAAADANALRLSLWSARQSGHGAAAAPLLRERNLREAQSSFGREAELVERRRRIDARLRGFERLHLAMLWLGRLSWLLVFGCVLGAARLFLQGRVAAPVPAPELRAWRRTLDAAVRVAAGSIWAWAPLAAGAYIAWAGSGSALDDAAAWLALCALATAAGGAFAPRDVAAAFAERDWWGPRLAAAAIQLIVSGPGPKAAASPRGAPESAPAAAGARAALAARLKDWLGSAAKAAEPAAWHGRFLGAASFCAWLAAGVAALPDAEFAASAGFPLLLALAAAVVGINVPGWADAPSWSRRARLAFASLGFAFFGLAFHQRSLPRLGDLGDRLADAEDRLERAKRSALRLPKAEEAARGAEVEHASLEARTWERIAAELKPSNEAKAQELRRAFTAALGSTSKRARKPPLDALGPESAAALDRLRESFDRLGSAKRELQDCLYAVGKLLDWSRERDVLAAEFAHTRRQAWWGGGFAAALALASVLFLGRLLLADRANAPWRLALLWTAALLCPLGKTAWAPFAGVAWAAAGASLYGWLALWGLALIKERGLKATPELKLKRQLRAELPMLTRYLLAAVRRGRPLHPALAVYAEALPRRRDRVVLLLAGLAEKVEGGAMLHEAIRDEEAARGTRLFPPAFTALLAAGEASGELAKALGLALEAAREEEDLGARVRSVLASSAAIGAVVLAVFGFLLMFVIPTFQFLFASLGGELPALTRAVLWVSSSAKLLLVPMALFLTRSVFAWRRHGLGDPRLMIPGMRALAATAAETRLCQGLALLLGSGYPADRALELVGGALEAGPAAKGLEAAAENVRRGSSLAKSLESAGVGSGELVWACELGEHRGDLPDTLRWLAGHLQLSTERRLALVTELVERSSTMALGLIVALAVLAMFLPMFEVSTLSGG